MGGRPHLLSGNGFRALARGPKPDHGDMLTRPRNIEWPHLNALDENQTPWDSLRCFQVQTECANVSVWRYFIERRPWADRLPDRPSGRQSDRPTARLSDRLSDHLAVRPSARPSNRPSDCPTVRPTDRPNPRPKLRPTVGQPIKITPKSQTDPDT